jgi:murein DD-endopeptidase MepM/ murein hydrolase activator NlpD
MKYLLAMACFFSSLPSFSQGFPSKNYPRDYFRDPLDIPISLAANFGELRPNHYHMGLDIRTQKRVNLPVFAAADGYIAHVKIEPEGFGQAIYINHPNGYTTLYAHLNQFFPALAAYVKRQQYKTESWKIFLDIPPGLFPIRKGQQIAYSGSTGGSQGPHLHFEIRQTAGDINLNPLLFGLPVPDNEPPVILRLAVYDRGHSVYEQAPGIYPVRKIPAGRQAADINGSRGDDINAGKTGTASAGQVSLYAVEPGLITVSFPWISFAISAFDSQSGSANPNGIYQAMLFDGGQAITGFQMDRISYEYTRNINAHIDYRTREKGGPFLQHLARLPGYNPPSIYQSFRPDTASQAGDGVIDLSDGVIHNIRIEVTDPNGNVSELTYRIRYETTIRKSYSGDRPRDEVSVKSDSMAGKEFYPGMLDGYETADCAFYIPDKGLYDSAYIGYVRAGEMRSDSASSGNASSIDASSGVTPTGYPVSDLGLTSAVSPVHAIGFPWIPLQDPLLVRIRPVKEISAAERDRVVMVRMAGNEKEVQRPEWQGGWASARFREFGNFQLVEDQVAPVIQPVGFRDGALLNKAAGITFRVKDNLGAIRSFRAELDPPETGGAGQWLCFANDKGRAFIYTFDEHCPHGKHLLRVVAEDEAGNTAVGIFHFTR